MKRCEELQLGCFRRPQRTPTEKLVRIYGEQLARYGFSLMRIRHSARPPLRRAPGDWPFRSSERVDGVGKSNSCSEGAEGVRGQRLFRGLRNRCRRSLEVVEIQ